MLRSKIYWMEDLGGAPRDYVGRFQNLDGDFEYVCKAMDIPHISFPHKLKAASVTFPEHYEKRSINFVREVYVEETLIFGHSFES